jgi:hypothetical protein
MKRFGPDAFFVLQAVLLGLIAAYTLWRATRRAPPPVVAPVTPVTAQATAVAMETAAGAGR